MEGAYPCALRASDFFQRAPEGAWIGKGAESAVSVDFCICCVHIHMDEDIGFKSKRLDELCFAWDFLARDPAFWVPGGNVPWNRRYCRAMHRPDLYRLRRCHSSLDRPSRITHRFKAVTLDDTVLRVI